MTNKYVNEVNRLVLKNQEIDESVKQLYFQLLHEIVEKRDCDLDISKLQNEILGSWLDFSLKNFPKFLGFYNQVQNSSVALNKTNNLLVLEKDFHQLKAEHERVLRIYVQQASSIDSLNSKLNDMIRTTEYLKSKIMSQDEQIPFSFDPNFKKIASPISKTAEVDVNQHISTPSGTILKLDQEGKVKSRLKSRSRSENSKNNNNNPYDHDSSQDDLLDSSDLYDAGDQVSDINYVDMSTTSIASCKTAYERGITMSAILLLDLINTPVACDTKNSEGWLVIQQRQSTDVNFNQNFRNYKLGFGSFSGNFWLGLENLYKITHQPLISDQNKFKKFKLKIEMFDWENNFVYAEYDEFSVSDESDGYRLTLGKYSGTAGDSMSEHHNMKFTTKDLDNDPMLKNCNEYQKGGWWYHMCADSNLNGVYYKNGNGFTDNSDGVFWATFRGITYSLKQVQMMIREADDLI